MKTQIVIRFILGLVVTLIATGCINNGNLANKVKPLPYRAGEEAVTTKVVTKDVSKPGVEVVTEQVTKTGLAVNQEIQLERLDTAEKVGVARAGGGNTYQPGLGGVFSPGNGSFAHGGGGAFYSPPLAQGQVVNLGYNPPGR